MDRTYFRYRERNLGSVIEGPNPETAFIPQRKRSTFYNPEIPSEVSTVYAQPQTLRVSHLTLPPSLPQTPAGYIEN